MRPPSNGNIVDVSGGMVVRPNPVRSYLPQEFWNRRADYFGYSVEFNTLAISAVGSPQTFQVDNDQDFLVLGLSCEEATAAAGTTEQTYWPVLIQISENTGANWFSDKQHLHNVAGRGSVGNPNYTPLPYPRFVSGGSTVTVRLDNLEATARRLWILFHGVQIFR